MLSEEAFVAGVRGAIGTWKDEEMANIEAFFVPTMVTGFVDGAGGAIGTCKDEEQPWRLLLLPGR